MTKFSDFVAQTQAEEAPESLSVDGTFRCQICHQDVDDADYFFVEKILKWTCPEGHVSYVEDFVL